MIYTFKSCGVQAAIDSRDGSIRILDALMYSMLPSLPSVSEMSKELPMSIRYALAKYDSQDLKRAYSELYEIFKSDKVKLEPDGIGKYIMMARDSFDLPNKIPSGSTVVTYADSSARAEMLIKAFPGINFEFAADIPTYSKIKAVCDDTVAVFEFSSATDLIEQTAELFSGGIERVAGYPKSGVAVDEAVKAYEKLCRELVRMSKRENSAGTFIPFTFQKSNGGLAKVSGDEISPCRGGTFSSIYIVNGMMPFNAAFLESDAIIDKCAECAVVLSAK